MNRKDIKADNLVFTISSAVVGGIGGIFLFLGIIFIVIGRTDGESGFYITGGALAAVAVLFLMITIALLVVASNRTKKLRSILAEWYYVMATFVRTDYDYRVQVNFRSPQRAFCRYTDEYGTVHEFRSVCFWKPLREEVYVEPTEVPVYMRRGDFSTYYVDIASLMDNEEQVKKHY